MRVDLVWLSHAAAPLPEWEMGEVVRSAPDPPAVALRVDALSGEADAVLFWDAALGAPDAERVREALAIPGDVWHAGLRLGQGGLPRTMDFVNPVWRLNRDPDRRPGRDFVAAVAAGLPGSDGGAADVGWAGRLI